MCNVYASILGFLVQPFCGLVHICKTDTKELTNLVHARAPDIFHLEFHKALPLMLFFLAYSTSLSQVITNYNINHHLYADDTQVYISLSPTDTHIFVSTVNDCLTDILSWME